MSFIMRPIRFASTGYIIEGSGLFDGSSGYLTRTPSAGNSKTFTISCVFKRGNLASGIIFVAGDWNAAYGAAYFNSGNQLIFEDYTGSGGVFNIRLTSTPLFRDPSAYYHLVVKYNSTAGTPSASDNGMFINGVQILDLAHNTYPDQDDTSAWNTNVAHRVGWAVNGGSLYYDGYVAQLVHIEGQALNADSFGETTDDGFWQINDASELTFGTNGFLLSGKSLAAGTDSNVTGYSPGSVVFSGTPYITRGADLTGIADGNTGLISAWVKFGSDGSSEYLWGATTDNNEIQVYRRSDNTLWVNIQDTGNNGDLFLKTSETITVASGWTHLLISWDVSAGYSDIYINDSQSSLSLDTTTSGGLDYTHSNHNFFASDSGDSSEIFNGEAADFWLTVNQTRFELTTESNRRKFISSDKYAVDLGSDGSTPTGTAPLVFFHLDRGEAPANFFANAGTGGTTSLSSSSLTEGSDPNNRHFTPAGTITATNDSPTNGDA